MLQMSFGIGERDVCAVLQKYWEMVVNPDNLTAPELARSIWAGMDDEIRDDLANAVMDAFLEDRDEEEAVQIEVRKYLSEHRFLVYAPRLRRSSVQADLLHAQRKFPERRQAGRHT